MTHIRRKTLVRGTTGGGVAFLLGYLVTWILAGSKAAAIAVSGPFGGGIPDWKAVQWLFYDSHFVGTRTPTITGPDGTHWGGGDLIDTVGLLGVEYLYVVPIVFLVAAGVAVASMSDVATPQRGLLAGITVSIGYLALVAVGLFVATAGGIAPSAVRAIVIAGLVYPVAFGGLGGVAVGFYRDKTAGSRETSPAN